MAALDDVVRIPHYNDSCCSWHAQPLTKYFPFGKIYNKSVPFFPFSISKGSIVGTGKYKGATVGTSPAYGCSAQIAEVTVDEETGQITVDRITDAHDCGRAINVTSVEGQMEGSVSMGLGEALFEEVKFDNKGHVINADLAEYKIPTMLDMPQVKTIIVESNEPNGPFGAKEVGEGAIMPTIPAILNAVYDGDLIVEHNDRFVYPQKYAEIAVREGDTFEFINPNIGG